MRYIDQHGNVTNLTPTDGWRYAAGCWKVSGGKTLNLPEWVAEQGGFLVPDTQKDRNVMRHALDYAKQRRERSLLMLQREIDNLNKAIALL